MLLNEFYISSDTGSMNKSKVRFKLDGRKVGCYMRLYSVRHSRYEDGVGKKFEGSIGAGALVIN